MDGRLPHIVRFLDHTGDTTVAYDPTDRAAVTAIEQRFVALMERNFVAFDVSTRPGRVIAAFDPSATEIIVSPQFAGG